MQPDPSIHLSPKAAGPTAAPAAQPAHPTPTTQDLLPLITDATIRQQMEELVSSTQFARALAGSGYFKDTLQTAQAVTKIMIGKELGIPPSASVMGINIQNGRVGFSAELIAALLKKHAYSWKFVQHDAARCEIACYHNGKAITHEDGSPARVAWTIEDAKRAGLTEPRGASKEMSVYERYPEDMLFWRCITRFMRRFAPEVTKGFAGYTPDEMMEIEQADIEAARAVADAGLVSGTREKAESLRQRLAAANNETGGIE